MLTSITPLGERGRGNRFWLTRAWLFVGHVLGGLALGGMLAAVSFIVGTAVGRVADDTVLAVIAVSTVLAVIADLGGARLPGRRQVDERWLTSYRGWVYGLGFGVQLGFGLVTVVNTLLVGVVLLAGVLLLPSQAVALGALYGLSRGVGATVNGGVRSVGDLRRLHRRIDRSERAVQWTSLVAAGLIAVGALAVA